MKKFLILLWILVPLLLQAQYTEDLGVSWLFQRNSHTWADSVLYNSSTGYFYLATDTLADTITSNPIYNSKGDPQLGNFWVSGAVYNDSTKTGAPDTINSVLQIGVYCGEGYPDSSGILWKNLITVSQDTIFKISLVDSSWWIDFATSRSYLRILETTAQKNNYLIWAHPYRGKY